MKSQVGTLTLLMAQLDTISIDDENEALEDTCPWQPSVVGHYNLWREKTSLNHFGYRPKCFSYPLYKNGSQQPLTHNQNDFLCIFSP